MPGQKNPPLLSERLQTLSGLLFSYFFFSSSYTPASKFCKLSPAFISESSGKVTLTGVRTGQPGNGKTAGGLPPPAARAQPSGGRAAPGSPCPTKAGGATGRWPDGRGVPDCFNALNVLPGFLPWESTHKIDPSPGHAQRCEDRPRRPSRSSLPPVKPTLRPRPRPPPSCFLPPRACESGCSRDLSRAESSLGAGLPVAASRHAA